MFKFLKVYIIPIIHDIDSDIHERYIAKSEGTLSEVIRRSCCRYGCHGVRHTVHLCSAARVPQRLPVRSSYLFDFHLVRYFAAHADPPVRIEESN